MSLSSRKISLLVLAANAVFFGTAPAMAQSKVSTYSTQVIVQNAFTITETTPLNLGTIAAVSSNTAGTQAASTTTTGTQDAMRAAASRAAASRARSRPSAGS